MILSRLDEIFASIDAVSARLAILEGDRQAAIDAKAAEEQVRIQAEADAEKARVAEAEAKAAAAKASSKKKPGWL
jgi:hypothetical protein